MVKKGGGHKHTSGGSKKNGGSHMHKSVENHSGREHGSFERKERMRRKLRVTQLQRALQKEKDRLCDYKPPAPPKKKRKKGRLGQETWKLRGAARPAAELAEMDRLAQTQEVIVRNDIFGKNKGSFYANSETRPYLSIQIELAGALRDIGAHKKAAEELQAMMKLDKTDHLCARHKLVSCLLDMGEAGEARQLIQDFEERVREPDTIFGYSLLMIEAVSCMVLEEEVQLRSLLKSRCG
jgi:hypothetical protein